MPKQQYEVYADFRVVPPSSVFHHIQIQCVALCRLDNDIVTPNNTNRLILVQFESIRLFSSERFPFVFVLPTIAFCATRYYSID